MKKVMFSLFVILCVLSSCKNQDEVINPVNNDVALKAQLSRIPAPSKEEVQKAISGSQSSMQKVVSDNGNNVQVVSVVIFPLDSTKYFVDNYSAIKYFVYYEINSDGYRQKYLTIKQEFLINGGVINEKNYSLSASVGCNFSKWFYLENNNNISQITFFFHFDDGKEFAYYGYGDIKLPPIAGGKWQLKVNYNDGDMNQQFMSQLIDYYAQSNMIGLQFEIKEENTLSVVSLNKNLIKDSYMVEFISKDDSDGFIYMSRPVAYNESSPDVISFDLPVKDVIRVIIYGSYGAIYYSVRVNPSSPLSGKILYDLVSN